MRIPLDAIMLSPFTLWLPTNQVGTGGRVAVAVAVAGQAACRLWLRLVAGMDNDGAL